MIPIGRGQRELIIGDRQTGKTTVAIDASLTKRNSSTKESQFTVYVAVVRKVLL